jgi:hypothetical protein
MASHDVAGVICLALLSGGGGSFGGVSGGSVSFGRAPAASPFGRVGSGQSGQSSRRASASGTSPGRPVQVDSIKIRVESAYGFRA